MAKNSNITIKLGLSENDRAICRWIELVDRKMSRDRSFLIKQSLLYYKNHNTHINIGKIYLSEDYHPSVKVVVVSFKDEPELYEWLMNIKNRHGNLSRIIRSILYKSIDIIDDPNLESLIACSDFLSIEHIDNLPPKDTVLLNETSEEEHSSFFMDTFLSDNSDNVATNTGRNRARSLSGNKYKS